MLHGRVGAAGPGKESTTGHWELMGVKVEQALPDLPRGLSRTTWSAALEQATGQRFCCNRPFSGTAVLDASSASTTCATGELILYTSADSVLQIAAHVDVLSEPELYRVCEAAREVMDGEHAVGRVIARPFEGAAGSWHRREGRRDFALPPPSRSYLEELQAAGVPVHGVGKIRDLFAGVGRRRQASGGDERRGDRVDHGAAARRWTPGWSSSTWWRPTSSTATATTCPALPRRCARSTTPWPGGCRCCATTTCWC